jgi:hypothetical protein
VKPRNLDRRIDRDKAFHTKYQASWHDSDQIARAEDLRKRKKARHRRNHSPLAT